MRHLDTVSAEGGPFLLADAKVAQSWRGVEGDGSDYERACQIFYDDKGAPGGSITIDQTRAVVWEPEGAGIADVLTDQQGRLILIRVWIDASDDTSAVLALAGLPLNAPINIGSLELTSGVLAVLWAAESGDCIETLDIAESERPTGEMADDSSGLLVCLSKGVYSCLHDEVELNGESARRCHLIKQ